MDAKKEPSALDAAGSRVLTHMAAGRVRRRSRCESSRSKDRRETRSERQTGARRGQRIPEDAGRNLERRNGAAINASAAFEAAAKAAAQDLNAPPRAVRHRLQEERASITHKFSIAGHEGYITVGLYPTGQPGEIFIKMAKEGSTVSGMMDSFATADLSGSPARRAAASVLCEKFAHTRFEPSGWTGNEQIGYAKSLMDYIFRWLHLRFLSGEQLTLFAGLAPQPAPIAAPPTLLPETEPEDDSGISQGQLARLAEEVARKLNQVSGQSTLGRRNRHGIDLFPRQRHPAGNQRRQKLRGPPHQPARDPGSRHLSRIRRHARYVRHGRRPKLRCLRSDHGPQRQLLPLHELRVDIGLFLGTLLYFYWGREASLPQFVFDVDVTHKNFYLFCRVHNSIRVSTRLR